MFTRVIFGRFRYGEKQLQLINQVSTEGSFGVHFSAGSIRTSFSLIDHKNFQLSSFFGIVQSGLEVLNHEEESNEELESEAYWNIDAGITTSIFLFKRTEYYNLYLPPSVYGNKAVSSGYLVFSVGVIPSLFNIPTNITGNLLYFTAGVRFDYTQKSLRYRIRRSGLMH